MSLDTVIKSGLAAVISAAALSAVPATVTAQGYDAPPPGSYWQSCRNVRTERVNGGALLSAECRDVRGTWRGSTLRFSDCRGEIENRDGQLTCYMGGGYNGGSYGGGGGYNGGSYGNGGYGNGGYGNGGYGNGGYNGGGYGNGGYNNGGYGGDRPRPVSGGNMTLFTGPNFAGGAFGTSREITNLPRQYNDQAMSLKIGRGAWEGCPHSDFRGRCQVFDRDVPDLNRFGMAQSISSMRQVR